MWKKLRRGFNALHSVSYKNLSKLKFADYIIPDFDLFGEQKQNMSGNEVTQKKTKILMVDDHPMVREMYREIIAGREGMEVVGEAANGVEAIRACRKTMPDVILMDINMPVMDGIEATRIIKSQMPDICVIGLSLKDEVKTVNKIKSAGAARYLTKMESAESVISTIESVVSAQDVEC